LASLTNSDPIRRADYRRIAPEASHGNRRSRPIIWFKPEAMQSRLIIRSDSSAMPAVDRFVAAFVTENGIAPDEASRILILLEELLTNLMKYGYPDRPEGGRAEIGLALNDGRLEIEFIDDGCAFDPFAAPSPNLEAPLETRAPGGLGLHILRSLTDEARYERRNGSNVIRLSRVVALAKRP
jgi:anti-sigma regulatory factor (Ser/Thr protein kinase)